MSGVRFLALSAFLSGPSSSSAEGERSVTVTLARLPNGRIVHQRGDRPGGSETIAPDCINQTVRAAGDDFAAEVKGLAEAFLAAHGLAPATDRD